MVESERVEFEQINKSLVDVFNNVMWIEEVYLQGSEFRDISLKEMHIIAAISMYDFPNATEIARLVHLKPSAMTTALDKLVKKGYIERQRSEKDRREVKLGLTHRGRIVYRAHEAFHRDITHSLTDSLSDEQTQVVWKVISQLENHLQGLHATINDIDGKINN